jgi:acid stress-induced BolA-like protein IbaG/YrbA
MQDPVASRIAEQMQARRTQLVYQALMAGLKEDANATWWKEMSPLTRAERQVVLENIASLRR